MQKSSSVLCPRCHPRVKYFHKTTSRVPRHKIMVIRACTKNLSFSDLYYPSNAAWLGLGAPQPIGQMTTTPATHPASMNGQVNQMLPVVFR